ncbi:MAG: hypothetical protein EBZ48_11515 [Proteobacteria bacterium]|nr:hypothetical protein [Pseudomonadota bacterium]
MSADVQSSPRGGVATEGELPIRRFSTPGSSKFGLDAIWSESAKLHVISRRQMVEQLGSLAWKSFTANPVTAFLSLLTISIVLTLFGAFLLLLQNVSTGVSGRSSAVSLRLFLFDDISPQSMNQLRAEVIARAGVKAVRMISKEGALAEFKAALAHRTGANRDLRQLTVCRAFSGEIPVEKM